MKTLVTAFALAMTTAIADAAIVYNNTATATGTYNALLPAGQVNSLEHGNQVTLAGSERVVTHIAYFIRSLGQGVSTFKTTIRFYQNDGPAGRPGTMLWDSGPVMTLIDSGANLLYGTSVPNIAVPGTFTWTLQITDRQGDLGLIGPPEFTPPTVGGAPMGFWRRFGIGPTGWEYTGLNEAPFGARLTAVPLGDCNADGHVGLADLAAFDNCLSGPGGGPASVACRCADFDLDFDVDLRDFADWQTAFTTP